MSRPRLPAPWASAALTLGLSWVGVGCTEPPSYLVHWNVVDEAGLADPASAPELTTVKQCADVGIERVRITTLNEDNSIVDVTQYGCFPSPFESGDGVEIPSLPPGDYRVEVAGLRRTGDPWVCVEDPDAVEPAPCIALAEASVTVAEGALPSVEVVLLQPTQCDDGVDNDRDGRVDGKDPACILNSDGLEADDASVTLFQISVSFLGSAVVRPANVSVEALRLEVDGEPLAEVTAVELDYSQWPFRLPLVTESFDPGTHLFTLTAVDDVDGLGAPLTTSFEVEFSVSDTAAGFVLEQVDFNTDEFLAPIVEPIALTTGLLLDPDDATGPSCTLGGFLGGGLVTLDSVWMRVTDGGGQPVDAATLGLSGLGGGGSLVPVDEAGGWVSFACPTTMLTSEPLDWGSYEVELEGRIADAVCFSSGEALPLAPVGQGGAQNFYLQRVVDAEGAPPAGCEECATDTDCSGQICDAGICKDKQP